MDKLNLGEFEMPLGMIVFFDKMIQIGKQRSFLMVSNTMVNRSGRINDHFFHYIKHDTVVTEFPLMLPVDEFGIFRSNRYGVSFFAGMV